MAARSGAPVPAPASSPGARETIRLTGAQALVRYLQAQHSERDGVRRRVIPALMGIFGHGNVCGLGQALDELGDQLDLPYLQPKHEQAMVHSAIGFAKMHDRLSTLACTASVGPGSTNMITGAATATVNRIPVLLIAADTFANRRQGPVMQALEHRLEGDATVNDCFRPVSAFFDRISRPEQLLTALPQAMRVLLDPAETGAVTLSLTQDAQGEAYDFPLRFFEPRTWRVARRPPAPEELDEAAALIRTAERPLIVAGGGVHYAGAREELLRLAEAARIPVAETSAGKGAMGDSPLYVGGLGRTGTRAANALAADADVVICVGTRLTDVTTGSASVFQHDDVRFVGVNVTAADACKLGAAPVVADARLALDALATALDGWEAPAAWADGAAEAWRTWRAELAEDLADREGERMSQGQVLAALERATDPRDAIVVASGSPHGDMHKLWKAHDAARCLLEVGFSCMCHEIPAAIGVRMAEPELREVYAVIGDGTYLMGASELATAAQEGLKITVVVIENHGFQSIHSLQRRATGSSWGLEFRSREDGGGLSGPYVAIDYAANACSFGCAAFEAGTVAELEAAIEAARAETRPTVIVARVEPLRRLLDSRCWWDVGIAEVSEHPEMRAIAAEHVRGRATQRFHV